MYVYKYDSIGSDIDYDYEEYNVTFPSGATTVSFDIMIINDANITDEYKLFNISISSINNGHYIGNPGVATIVRATGEHFIMYIIYDAYVHMYLCM